MLFNFIFFLVLVIWSCEDEQTDLTDNKYTDI